jgi:hypothetical protein
VTTRGYLPVIVKVTAILVVPGSQWPIDRLTVPQITPYIIFDLGVTRMVRAHDGGRVDMQIRWEENSELEATLPGVIG